jgi:predicted outer membrane repeat protein
MFSPVPKAAFILISGATCAAQPVHYVNSAAQAGGNGLSWVTAFRDLQDALALPGQQEIWVVAGEYRADRGTANRNERFRIGDGAASVAVYGGFAGNEVLRNERDPNTHVTVLTGDLLGNDAPGFVNYSDNSFSIANVRKGSLLDGFTVRGATDSGIELGSGATVVGCLIAQNMGTAGAGLKFSPSSPIIAALVESCRFVGNQASERGGGISTSENGLTVRNSIFQSNIALGIGGGAAAGRGAYENCTFESNTAPAATGLGGAMFDVTGPVSGCTFAGNSANKGGAVSNTTTSLQGCAFESNTATDGGALYLGSSGYELKIRDCLFAHNNATRGGAIAATNAYSIHLISCTFLQNAGFYGGALNLSSGRATAVNSKLVGNSTVIPTGTGGSGGAIYLRSNAECSLVNCVLSGNHAEALGGAVACEALLRFNITGCTFSLNRADTGGGGIYSVGAVGPQIANSILWNNIDSSGQGLSAQLAGSSPFDLRYSTVSAWAGVPSGPGNSGVDPGLVDPDGPDNTPGTADDDVRLPRFSNATDSADNDAIPPDVYDLNGNGNFNEPIPYDVGGNPRRRDDPNFANTGAGTGHPSDRGALEFQPPACYANCDDSYAMPALNINDFLCFQNRFAQGNSLANCDGSTVAPILNVNDFLCFSNLFATGCP